MLWWGIIDLRINGVSPNPTICHKVLSEEEFQSLRDKATKSILRQQIKISESTKMLLEAMFFTDNISIKALTDEFGANGIRGIKFYFIENGNNVDRTINGYD